MIHDNIKKYRKEKGLTQEQLAKQVDVSIMTIRRFEAGTREPKIYMLEKIAAALGVQLAQLYGVESPGGFLQFFTDMASYDDESKDLLLAFDKLNHTGKEIAVQRVQELTLIEQYTEPDGQEPPF